MGISRKIRPEYSRGEDKDSSGAGEPFEASYDFPESLSLPRDRAWSLLWDRMWSWSILLLDAKTTCGGAAPKPSCVTGAEFMRYLVRKVLLIASRDGDVAEEALSR